MGPAASWELDVAGGIRHNAAAARDEVQAAEANRIGTRIIVAADAADAYLQVRGYQARIAIAKSQIETDEHLLKLVQNRYDAGAATKREIAQAQALLQQARSTLPPLRLALEKQLNRLDVLMGAQPGTYAHELDTVTPVPSIPRIANQEPTMSCVADQTSSQPKDGSRPRTSGSEWPSPSTIQRFLWPECSASTA